MGTSSALAGAFGESVEASTPQCGVILFLMTQLEEERLVLNYGHIHRCGQIVGFERDAHLGHGHELSDNQRCRRCPNSIADLLPWSCGQTEAALAG